MTVHITLDGSVAALRGWGQASPPQGAARIELRDPGELAFLRPRGVRRDRELATIPITRMSLAVNTAQFARGGNFEGGGFGIRGAVTGMAVAGMLNRASSERWEETRLHVTETLRMGVTRRVSFTLPTFTPARLVELLEPALTAWGAAWVSAVTAGTVDAFADVEDLEAGLEQVDAIQRRGMLDEADACSLRAHVARPFIDGLAARLAAHEISHADAPTIARAVTYLNDQGCVTAERADTLHALIEAIPAPETVAEEDARRRELIARLTEARQAGAITEAELQAEQARLLATPRRWLSP